MSTPNPLAPQGSLLEQQGRGKSTLQIITFIGALHVFFLCGLLWIGCKKDDRQTGGLDPLATPGGTGLQPLDPNTPPINPADPTGMAPVGAAPIGGPGSTSAPPTGLVSPPPPMDPGVTGIAPLTGSPTNPGGAGAPTTTDAGSGAAAPGTEYKVQKGDTGSGIARKHGITLAALKAANPTAKWTALKLDQKINIPAGGAAPATSTGTGAGPAPTTTETAASGTVYEVKPGDSGAKIARKFGVSWKAIRQANHLSSDILKPKQKLTIPGKGPGAASAPAPVEPAPVTTPAAVPIVSPVVPAPAPGRP
jgi:LysM repeat protein